MKLRRRILSALVALLALAGLAFGARYMLRVNSAPATDRVHTIAERGRLVIERDTLPANAAVRLALEISEPDRAAGARPVRIISTDGRRFETSGTPSDAAPGGTAVRLEIERSFLVAGHYLIEIDTTESHPLNLRRYVLEIR